MIRAADLAVRRGFLVLLAVALVSCGGGGDDEEAGIDPANANAVMANLLVKVGGTTATLQQGAPPAASSDPAAPKADAGTDAVTTTTTQGSTVSFPVTFQASQAMAAIFAKVGGSTVFFEADDAPGGKVAKVLPASGNGNSFVVTLQLLNDFQPGEFCLDLSGEDAAGRVSNVVTVCAQLVDEITQPAQDQPSADALLDDLAGSWVSPCAAFQTGGASGFARIGFSFEGTAYSQFLETWSSAGCSGTPDSSGTVLSGTLQPGSTLFLPASGKWATAVDFIPDAASAQAGARTCFNALRFEDGNPDRFFLGLPIGFTVNNQSAVAGSCVSPATRPAFLSDDIPFVPGSQQPVNTLPTANAGADRTVAPNSAVQLDGSASSDAEGPIATYAWTQVGTQTVTLTGANTATPSFTAPAAPATLTFQLAVTDNSGGSDTDTVVVTVATNDAPTANAGADQTVESGATVTLQGSASDTDGTVSTLTWSQTAGPTVTLSDRNAANPTFSTVGLGSATLTFELVATDDQDLESEPDSVTITVTQNLPPVAEAGPSRRFAELGDTVTLSGDASTDADGTIVSYQWEEISGDAIADLEGTDTDTVTFTMPNTAHADFVFQLTVTDDDGATGTDTVTVTRLVPFKLVFETTNFSQGNDDFTFEIRTTGGHTIGNLFTDQSDVEPFPQGPVFNDFIQDNGNCEMSSSTAGEIDCNGNFVTRYLGTTIDDCFVDEELSDAVILTANNNTRITFNVVCGDGTVLEGFGEVGIGQNGGSLPFGNNPARSAQTGHEDEMTNTCNSDGCNEQ